MQALINKAESLLKNFKGSNYVYGTGAAEKIGAQTKELGKSCLVVGNIKSPWFKPILDQAIASLEQSSVKVLGLAEGAKPNAPREDVYRLHGHIVHKKPEVLVVIAGGSGIDAAKSASVLATFGDIQAELDPFFGVGQVTKLCQQTNRQVLPVMAAMTAASSAAHLTKYSNVTDPVSGQKKLIIDEAIVPPRAVFDHSFTLTQPSNLTVDGGLDGLSHCLEVYLGAKEDNIDRIEEVCLTGIELIVTSLRKVVDDPTNIEARRQVALATDLGGYAIMLGGTNGPHLNSFSLVNYLSHGRACALMYPYYTMFFAPAVVERVRKVGMILENNGYVDCSIADLVSEKVGEAVARGLMAFNRSVGFPIRLQDIDGLDQTVMQKILTAAKDPQLESKLQNMPLPMKTATVDKYMGSILEAAWTGDLGKIVTM